MSQSAVQVDNLEKGMWESRMRSAVQLLGRAPVQGGEAGINAAAATVRAQCTPPAASVHSACSAAPAVQQHIAGSKCGCSCSCGSVVHSSIDLMMCYACWVSVC